MLHEAWSCDTAGFKWEYACASRRPVYAENSNQLCFFASPISLTVCHLSHSLLHCMSNAETARIYELLLSRKPPTR